MEILTETGLVGFSILTIIIILTLYNTFYKKYFSGYLFKIIILLFLLYSLFFIEIFPIKSTGSFFTTGNATYPFLILGVLVGLFQKDNLIEKKI